MVVDASFVVAALVDCGPNGLWAAHTLEHAQDRFAPELVLVETYSALRRLEASKKLPATQARQALLALARLPLELLPTASLANRIWELRRNLSPYDATYVAMAEQLGMPLATLDRKLAKATGPRCEFLLPKFNT